MIDERTTRPRRALALLLLAWLPAAAAGWGVHHAWTGPGWRVGWWLVCVVLACGMAAAITGRLPTAVRAEPAVLGAGLVALGWAVATAAGWFLDVAVGGTASGLVTGLALAAARTATPLARVASVGGLGVLALILGWLVLGYRIGVLAVGVTIACGLAAVCVAARVLAPSLALRPVAVLTVAWAVAWVGAFVVTQAMFAEASHGLAVGAEIVFAIAAGSAVLAVTTRNGVESTWRVIVRWTVAAALGVVGSVGLAMALHALAVGPVSAGLLTHLDVGTTLGLGVAAGFAVLPTLRAVAGTPRPRSGTRA